MVKAIKKDSASWDVQLLNPQIRIADEDSQKRETTNHFVYSSDNNMYIWSKKLLPINEPQMLAFFKKNFNFTYTLLWFHQNSIVKKLMDPLYQLQFY